MGAFGYESVKTRPKPLPVLRNLLESPLASWRALRANTAFYGNFPPYFLRRFMS